MAAYIADLDAGRARIPEEWEVEGPAATIGLGDAADVDLAELAAMVGPDGLGGEVFAQDRSADVMRPGPVLAALTEQAAGDLGRLTDNQVLGAMAAAGRLAARAEYLRLAAVAEFTRRRDAQYQDAKARGVPRGCRDGEFPDAELGMELVTSQNAARDTMDQALDLETRLPRTRAALAAGLIDEYRARLIWRPTRHLTDADAGRADEILAVLAAGLRYDQLARKAAAVAMKLDPDAFTRGKDKARADRQRVTAGREESGNAFLSGRELAVEDALASKAHIDALAVALRRGGLPGTLQRLRVLAFTDLTQGRHPLDRLAGPGPADDAGRDARQDKPAAGGQPGGDGDGDGTGDGDGDGDDDASWDGGPDMTQWQHERRGTTEGDDDDDHPGSGGVPPGPPAPFPALINLTVPAGTILGWSAAPGQAGGWGLTDPGDTRRLLQAASMHPRTRWCATLLGPRRHRRRARLRPRPPPLDPAAGQRPAKPRRPRRPAGRRARRPPAETERHVHSDRQGQLRPRQRRKPLYAQPQARPSGPGPYRDLPRPRLRRTGLPQRPRPHARLPRRNHLSVRPGPALQTPPSRETSPRLEAGAARTRRHDLDHALRAHLHHPAHRLRDVIQAIRLGSSTSTATGSAPPRPPAAC